MDITDHKSRLVQTYDAPNYDNPSDAINDYERVQRHCSQYPQQGSYAVSKSLDLPRGRIRSWVDGDGMPDCYRGVQTALDNGWLPDLWDDETAQALNCLAAWVLSSGGINQNWVPTFVTDDDRAAEQLRSYAESANVWLEQIREPDDNRPNEWRPKENASVLGRVLYTWTDLKGDKRENETTFPTYLRDAPDHIALSFAQVYVQQRGVFRDDRGEYVQINVTRDASFFRALKACLQRVVDDEDDIRGDNWPLRIYGDAIETLRQYPEIEE